MAQTIIHIQFRLNVSTAAYQRAVAMLAHEVADTPGLQWKIWLMSRDERAAGGIYLFSDEQAAEAFLAGPLLAQVQNAPILGDVQIAQFHILDNLTALTRGPLLVGAENLQSGSMS